MINFDVAKVGRIKWLNVAEITDKINWLEKGI